MHTHTFTRTADTWQSERVKACLWGKGLLTATHASYPTGVPCGQGSIEAITTIKH